MPGTCTSSEEGLESALECKALPRWRARREAQSKHQRFGTKPDSQVAHQSHSYDTGFARHGKHTGPLVEQPVCAFELKSFCAPQLSFDQCRLLALHSSTGLFHVNISVPYLRPSVPPSLRPSAPSPLQGRPSLPRSLLPSYDGGLAWGDGFADAAPRLAAQLTSAGGSVPPPPRSVGTSRFTPVIMITSTRLSKSLPARASLPPSLPLTDGSSGSFHDCAADHDPCMRLDTAPGPGTRPPSRYPPVAVR